MIASVLAALPGHTETWHTGFLAIDREGNKPLQERAHTMYNMARKGIIHLVQRKVKTGKYEYVWVRSRNFIAL